jgi:hypothetical protein
MESSVKKKPTHHDAKKILQWCVEKYGESKVNGHIPVIEYRKPDYSQEDYSGYYDEDEELIFVNRELVTTIKELVKTIIHEYCHYRYHLMEDYYVLAKYLKRSDNPMEKEAEKIENRDYKKCVNELFKLEKNKVQK